MRPREFDHDEVLRIAFDRFWRSGVRGTSLSDIARDAGVQRGSLYNAFGSKEALFLVALGATRPTAATVVEEGAEHGNFTQAPDGVFRPSPSRTCARAPRRGDVQPRGR